MAGQPRTGFTPGMRFVAQQPPYYHHRPHQFQLRPKIQFAPPGVEPDGAFDGKRMRTRIYRKTIDYNSSVVNHLENRIWQRDRRDHRAIAPDALYAPKVVPPQNLLATPMNCVTSRFIRTSLNKIKCPIFCVCWTPEGRRLVTGASSGEFTLWNGLTFNFETILQAHDASVRAMKWSHNDQWMLTGDHLGFVKYWQINMNNVKMYQAHKDPIRDLSFCPTDTKFASCSDDATVRIWDFLRCYEEKILRGHGADVKCVDWHPNKALIASGSKDAQQPIKLWDPRTGTSLATLHAHKHTVMEIRWNPSGNWLLTASRDHLIKIFDIRNLKLEFQQFKGHKKEATTLAWHPVHETLFASGGSDGSIMFWLVGHEKEVGCIDEAHDAMVWSLSWHPLGHILASGSNDHTTKFWTRNAPGDQMRDKYNLNTLPIGSEDVIEWDDNSGPSVPGLGLEHGLPEHLKAKPIEKDKESKVDADGKEVIEEEGPVIPGLDINSDANEIDQKLQKKKVPFAKPIPKQFEQAWHSGLQPPNIILGPPQNGPMPPHGLPPHLQSMHPPPPGPPPRYPHPGYPPPPNMHGPPMGPPMGPNSGNSGPPMNRFPNRPMGPGNEMMSQRPPNPQSRFPNPVGPSSSSNSWTPQTGPGGPSNLQVNSESIRHPNQINSNAPNGPLGPNSQFSSPNQMMPSRQMGPPIKMEPPDDFNSNNLNIKQENFEQYSNQNTNSSNQNHGPQAPNHYTHIKQENQSKFYDEAASSSQFQNSQQDHPHHQGFNSQYDSKNQHNGPSHQHGPSHQQGPPHQQGPQNSNHSLQQDSSNQNYSSNQHSGPSNFRTPMNHPSQSSNYGPRGTPMHAGPQFSTPSNMQSYSGPRDGPPRSQHGPRTVWEAPSANLDVKDEFESRDSNREFGNGSFNSRNNSDYGQSFDIDRNNSGSPFQFSKDISNNYNNETNFSKDDFSSTTFGDIDERGRDIDERSRNVEEREHPREMQWEPVDETGRTDTDFYENVDRPISLLDMDTQSLKKAWDERTHNSNNNSNSDSRDWGEDNSEWENYNYDDSQNTSGNYNRGANNWRGRGSTRGNRGTRMRGKPTRRNVRSRGGRSR